ncbi:hypothetical protein [Agrococcus lahaulensis]|uniref:hypothetical protein n=1 Tax=Agrococcus lahaulensis TaxID=341722 RepID=UPI0012EC6E5F|nr:hypothetical protein [Agrococcus lahaulensis]
MLKREDAELERQELEAEIRSVLGTTERVELRRRSMTSGTTSEMVRAIQRLAELDFLLAP